ncbi:MAG: hypothetical protein E7474_14805 [Ruminococcaceae bacterium]|nr:hypothetical protein [Oscillospiraceae bacterium]
MESKLFSTIKRNNWRIGTAVGIFVAAVLVLSSIWIGRSAKISTERAVHTVSDFYMQELAGRREQVVASNLNASIDKLHAALELLGPDDLSDVGHLQAFQSRMKKLYDLEKFAFVGEDGTIYTALGPQDNIGEYGFDYCSLDGAEISIKGLEAPGKKVVIAVPVERLPFRDLLQPVL